MALVCPKCGEENPDRARFCLSCASPLSDEAPEKPGREQRKVVSIVFSDLTGSTALGERLDSESLRQVMSRYYQAMREALERHGGTVEKFIGDAVMAVFGIPTLHEDDALRAVRAASEMGAALEALNVDLEARWGERLQTRTGVNTGEVVAGDPSRGDSFVVGDAVNVAARFEQAAGPGEVLIGEETYGLVRQAVEAEPVEPLELKGKSERMPAFRLLAVAGGGERSGREMDSPLVGRERELRQLDDLFGRAIEEGSARLAVMTGPAGVGKSRLSAEFLHAAEDRATVLVGRCLPYGSGITLYPVLEVVRNAAGIAEEDSSEDAQAKIAERVVDDDSAVIAERITTALGLSDAAPHPEETSWALRRLLESLAGERPLVVVFDDIHWGEPALVELIEYLADMTSAPVMFLCMARPELRERYPEFASRVMADGLELSLGPLDRLESRLLMDNLLGEEGLPRALSERIAQAAEGNPLFVEEMLRGLVDDGTLERTDDGWRLVGELDAVDVPPTIQALLAARLEGLDTTERGVIERAAVIGQEFWHGAISELSPEDARDVVSKQLEGLVRKELLRRGGTPFLEEEAFRFSHLMVRDVAYSTLLKEMRAELHERFADWLEERAGERSVEHAEIIGYHLEQAARYRGELGVADPRAEELGGRAAEKLAAAGARAMARGDISAAVNLQERALELLGPDDPERPRLMVRFGAALTQLGELTRADEALTEAVEAASAAGDEGVEYDGLIERAFQRFFTAQMSVEEAIDLAERAMPVFERVGDNVELARASRLLGAAEIFAGRLADALVALEVGLGHAQESGNDAEVVETIQWLVWTRYEGPLPIEDAVQQSDEFSGRGGDHRAVEATRLYIRAVGHAMAGRFSEAREHVARGKRIYAELGLRQRAAAARYFAGEVERLAGDPAGVERELRPALEELIEMGERSVLTDVAARLSQAMLAQGNERQARKLASVAAGSTARDDVCGRFTVLMVRAQIALARDAHDEAEELAREAVELARKTDSLNRGGDAVATLAEVLIATGRPDEARPLLADAIGTYEEKGNFASAGRTAERLDALDSAPAGEPAGS